MSADPIVNKLRIESLLAASFSNPVDWDELVRLSAAKAITSDGRLFYGGTLAEAFSAMVDCWFVRTHHAPPAPAIAAAVAAGAMSPCRSKRGVAIFDVVRHVPEVEAVGFNFKPAPFECDGSAECKARCRHDAVHAEQHALLRYCRHPLGLDCCEMVHVKVVAGDFVPSGGPSCAQCSKLILASGMKAMWLFHIDGWRRYPADEFHWLSMKAQR